LPLSFGNYPQRHNLDMEVIYASNDDQTLDVARKGDIDLVGGPEVEWTKLMVAEQLCQPIDTGLLPNFRKVDPFFAANSFIRSEGVLYGIPFTWGIIPMVYRPDRLSAPPASWFDILLPDYKGKVVMLGGPWGNIRLWGSLVSGGSAGRMTRAQLTETIDFLISVKRAHAFCYSETFEGAAEVMARGDAVISSFGWEPMVRWARAGGADVRLTIPKEGTLLYIDAYFIAKNARDRCAAHGLIDNALSTGAQLALARELGQGIVNREAIDRLPTELLGFYPYRDLTKLTAITSTHAFPPLVDDGLHVTYAQMQEEWERFRRS
jgi:spermidine/putrescine transport system substrate-binding protein